MAAISEPQNDLVTFPRYGWATKLHNYCIYIVTHKSKMATANASLEKINKSISQIVCKTAA